MGTFFNNLGITASSSVDPNGRAGGIWLLWEPSQVSINVFEANHQVIHATINRVDYEEWVLSAVYASPNPRNRDALWEGIEAISEDIQSPWLVAEDPEEELVDSLRESVSEETKKMINMFARIFAK
ncbi:hypothetical protein LOK49_LG07G02498 [Camellia lanceoleosa]|uniref:Uncharacterized protein n=1 Tax=Camellia lanceoleosa TaxID=1840588 RepID=A0ACC0GYV9_9ERIC|nr:hypothetical protein LOK49_LG07G02498 [Camellia lanceoleosa]